MTRPRGYKLEFILKLKIKHNDWLLADTCPQAAIHCALFRVTDCTQSKKDDKDQKSIQSNTTDDHKAAMNKCESMANTRHK